MANNEWRTPREYIEAARYAMGSIDVDPASNAEANKTVQATVFFDKETNGLTKDWGRNVWLNPPYGRGEAEPFISTLVNQYCYGTVYQAIVLLNTVYTSKWWNRTGINDIHSAICLPSKRIAFINPNTGEPEKGNDRDQVIVYVGENPDEFCKEFRKHGICYKKHEHFDDSIPTLRS